MRKYARQCCEWDTRAAERCVHGSAIQQPDGAAVASAPEGLDVTALLDRIEREMLDAPANAQWTMNNCLAAIGINHAEHRDRAIATGDRLGVFRDYPVSKGCTSPFAPIWIGEMVRRQR